MNLPFSKSKTERKRGKEEKKDEINMAWGRRRQEREEGLALACMAASQFTYLYFTPKVCFSERKVHTFEQYLWTGGWVTITLNMGALAMRINMSAFGS